MDYLYEQQGKKEVPTGLLYIDESVADMHEMGNSPATALMSLPYERLCPGSAKLAELMDEYR